MSDRTATLRDGAFIQRCYAIAERAVQAGDHPFGALLVHDGEILAEARNRVNSDDDVTAHAERLLIAAACRSISEETVAAATLYASTEPCVMCAGAIHRAGVRRVVYGVAGPALAAIRGERYRGVPVRELARAGDWAMQVVGPVMEDDGLRIHADFWPARGEA